MFVKVATGDKSSAEGFGGSFDQVSDDHGSARGDRWSGVGDALCVGLGYEDLIIRQVEGLCGNLAEDSVGALTELGGGDQELGTAFGGNFDGDKGIEAAFAGTGEAGAVEEGSEADTTLDGAGGVFTIELFALGMVVGLFESAGEHVLHVDRVGEELASRSAIAGGEEVPAAEFFGGEANGFCDLVHVAFEGEDALRGAEATEGSVRRDVGGHRFSADCQVRPVVGAGSVDGAAREDYRGEGGVGSSVDGEVDLPG